MKLERIYLNCCKMVDYLIIECYNIPTLMGLGMLFNL